MKLPSGNKPLAQAKPIPRRKTSLKLNLMLDYGEDIHEHLKLLESSVDLSAFLKKH